MLLFLVCILSISAISATGNTANENVISSNNNVENDLETNICYDDVSTSNMNDELILEENSGRDESRFRTDKTTTTNEEPLSFDELNKTINGNRNSTIYLSNNYKYEGDIIFKTGICINRDLTIYGNGVTLDGNNMARIFNVTNSNLNVNFYNINFINGKAVTLVTYESGGAIYGGNAYNCTFTNNKATQNGGAIYGGNAYNCTFTNNKATDLYGSGGAIYEGNAINCTFIGNNADAEGGAIYGGNAYNCTFTNNSAKYGGAICGDYNVYNCIFIGNNADAEGGAIRYGNAYNCTFINNSANDCGAICVGNAYNCIFTNNKATRHVGAIYEGNAINCTFTNNKATQNGGAIEYVNAYNCTFTNNSAKYGGAIYGGNAYNCTFTNNSAKYGGAMFMGNATLCRFNRDTTYNTTIIRSTLNVLNYTSSYQSGEKLQFNLTANGILYDGFNTTIRIYKNGGLVKIVYGLTGEGWVVDLIPGRYTAELSIPSYSGVTPSYAQITVLNLASEIITSPESTTYNVGKNLVITLKDENGNPISDALLTVTLDSTKKYTTDTNGQVKINVATLTPKTYTAKITYAGSDIYNGTTGTTKVTVKKATPKITAKSASFKLKVKTKKYTATFKTNKNQALKNTKVTLKVNGKTYTVKTNSKGQGVFKITNLKKKGSYTAVITVPTNNYYNKVSKNVKITVKK